MAISMTDEMLEHVHKINDYERNLYAI